MTKSISLSEDVYTLLNSIRGKGESFSEVIRRLTGNKGRLMEIVDLYPELSEVSEYEESVKRLRMQIDEGLKA
ncbi:MAG: antitoxin VapB family protein [Methanophagales archaeon]|nr:antitoxin VapB family protein [Methanophagales archaeon]